MKILKKLVVLSAVALMGQVEAAALKEGANRIGVTLQDIVRANREWERLVKTGTEDSIFQASEYQKAAQETKELAQANRAVRAVARTKREAAEAAAIAERGAIAGGLAAGAAAFATEVANVNSADQESRFNVTGQPVQDQVTYSNRPQSLNLSENPTRAQALYYQLMDGKPQNRFEHLFGIDRQAVAKEKALEAAIESTYGDYKTAEQAAANQPKPTVIDQQDSDNSELGQLGRAAGEAYEEALQAQEDYENIKHAGYADSSDVQALRNVARDKAMEAEYALQMLQGIAAVSSDYAGAVDAEGNNLVAADGIAAGQRADIMNSARGSRRQRLSDMANNAVYGVSRQFGKGSDISDLPQDFSNAKARVTNWTMNTSRNAYDATARGLGRAKSWTMSAPRNAYDSTRQGLSNGATWMREVPGKIKTGATSAWERFTNLFARNKQQAAQ